MGSGGERIEAFRVDTDENNVPNSLTYIHSFASEELNKRAYGVLNSVAVLGPF